MIRTDGAATIATPVTRAPERFPRVKPECTPGTAAFYGRYGAPCFLCGIARDYHPHAAAANGHPYRS